MHPRLPLRVLLALFLALAVPALGAAAQGGTPAPSAPYEASLAQFRGDVLALQDELAIPGLAFAVVRSGEVIAQEACGVQPRANGDGGETEPFTVDTPLRIASVTKSFTAVLAMQLVLAGELSVDDPVHWYLPNFDGPPGVTLRHLLSHTSEGFPGEEYVYSTNRYALLGDVLERVTGEPLAELLWERIQRPAGMRRFASPHLGAHAGLVSTVADMARYARALDGDALLTSPGKVQSWTPTPSARRGPGRGAPLPVGLGWFSQEIHGHRLVWSFGQDDPDHSSMLLLRTPESAWSLVLLANTDALSNPFRLLMGDVANSPFALAFLRAFLIPHGERPDAPRPRPRPTAPDPAPVPAPDWQLSTDALAARLDALEAAHDYRWGDELIARALVALWTRDTERAGELFTLALERYEAVREPDAVRLFLAGFLDDRPVRRWAARTHSALVDRHPHNRWVLLAVGYHHAKTGAEGKAAEMFERILRLPNQQEDFLHRLFLAWSRVELAKIVRPTRPERARRYLEAVVDSGVRGETLEGARALLEEVERDLRQEVGGSVP